MGGSRAQDRGYSRPRLEPAIRSENADNDAVQQPGRMHGHATLSLGQTREALKSGYSYRRHFLLHRENSYALPNGTHAP